MRKLLSILLVLGMLLSLAPMAFASEESAAEPVIVEEIIEEPAEEPALDGAAVENLSVSSKGVVTWSAFPGAAKYVINDIYGKVAEQTETTYNYKAFLEAYGRESWTYKLTVTAYNSASIPISDASTVQYEYTSMGKLDTPTITSWNGKTASWTNVENAEFYEYTLWDKETNQLLGQNWIYTNSVDLSYKELVSSREYVLQIQAKNQNGYSNSSYSKAVSYGWYDETSAVTFSGDISLTGLALPVAGAEAKADAKVGGSSYVIINQRWFKGLSNTMITSFEAGGLCVYICEVQVSGGGTFERIDSKYAGTVTLNGETLAYKTANTLKNEYLDGKNSVKGYYFRNDTTLVIMYICELSAAPAAKPTLTFAADAKSVKASGDYAGLYY